MKNERNKRHFNLLNNQKGKEKKGKEERRTAPEGKERSNRYGKRGRIRSFV